MKIDYKEHIQVTINNTYHQFKSKYITLFELVKSIEFRPLNSFSMWSSLSTPIFDGTAMRLPIAQTKTNNAHLAGFIYELIDFVQRGSFRPK